MAGFSVITSKLKEMYQVMVWVVSVMMGVEGKLSLARDICRKYFPKPIGLNTL